MGLRDALRKTRENIFGRVASMLRRKDPALLEEIEDILLSGDVGIETTEFFIEELKKVHPDKYLERLRELLVEMLSIPHESVHNPPVVYLFVGVNGVGKTTTIGKIGLYFRKKKKSVLFAACDTFRTGAQEQLKIWADRAGADIVSSQYGADPSAVAFDAFDAAVSRGVDCLLIDTAGRLHTKTGLMEEMAKIKRTLNKKREDLPQEILIVIDATTGQNAIHQVEIFNEKLGLTGIVLTKMDGTAKGGVILPIVRRFNLPVLFIGTGEAPDDIEEFNPEGFVDALLSTD